MLLTNQKVGGTFDMLSPPGEKVGGTSPPRPPPIDAHVSNNVNFGHLIQNLCNLKLCRLIQNLHNVEVC